MNIYKFSVDQHRGTYYVCNRPGDNSGQYINFDELNNYIQDKIFEIQKEADRNMIEVSTFRVGQLDILKELISNCRDIK